MKIKKIVNKIHLWLGFAAGLVVVISMTAAAIFVWDEELTDWYYADYVFVEAGGKALPVSELLAVARQALPGKKIYSSEIRNDPGRAYAFTAYKRRKEASGWTYWDDHHYWYRIYVNPYTGQVTGVVNMLTNWIELTRRLHQNLLLRYRIGTWIVGIATLIIFVMVLTGLVLWFPKNLKVLKQRLKIKWKARWRRVNYDIHNVGGFYTHLVILLLATTGLVWTFDWWTDGIYRLLGNDPKEVFANRPSPLEWTGKPTGRAEDLALHDAMHRRSGWVSIYLGLPRTDGEGEISAYVQFDGTTGWEESDQYTYHPITGELYWQKKQEEKLLGEKWRNSNYAIHVGSIYGLPTKILACFTALFCASLPVTGFLIWLGRRKKKKKQKNIRKAPPKDQIPQPPRRKVAVVR